MQNKKERRTQKLEIIKKWQESGLSQKRFCADNNIAYHAFHYWYKVYRSALAGAGSVLPLDLTPASGPDHVNVTGFNGIGLRIPVTDQGVWLIKQLLLS
jgi:hypothetical protein